jgi:hypothetical protein
MTQDLDRQDKTGGMLWGFSADDATAEHIHIYCDYS